MLNKLGEVIKRNLNYAQRTGADLLADETFLSIKTELILSAVLGAQIILAVIFLRSLASEMSSFASLREARLTVEKRLNQIQDGLLQVKKMPRAAENLLESLPESKDNYNLLENLNSAAGESQVNLLSVNFLPTKSSGFAGLTEQPVEIRLLGNYKNILSFITDLERSQRPVLTESAEYSTDDRNLTAGVVEANLVLKTFLIDAAQPSQYEAPALHIFGF